MNDNKNPAYCRCAFIGLLCLLTSQAFAQKKNVIKAITNPQKISRAIQMAESATISRATHAAALTNQLHILPNIDQFVNSSGVRINPLGDKHSAYPSKVTVLGSPKVFNSGIKIPHITTASNYIAAAERQKWIDVREKLSSLAYYKPTPIENLAYYLRHPVPAQTFQHIQKQYAELIGKIEATQKRIQPFVVYASLPGEGVTPRPEEVGTATELVYPIITQIRELCTALSENPFLEKQRNAWEAVFAAFNPLLASMIFDTTGTLARTDKRVLNTKEFNLYNPNGTDYLLPGSDSLLEKDLDDYESYAEERAEMLAIREIEKKSAAEVPALLNEIPSNLRIALINDDLLPRINFENWAKQGFLGHGATLETFADGSGFMEKVRHGIRYDLVITDLLVPYGGISMMPQLRQLDQNAVVIASSKFDRGEEDPEKLFNLGIDGYLWYTNRLDNGSVGYIEYLRAMKNYFHYKAQHNWQR